MSIVLGALALLAMGVVASVLTSHWRRGSLAVALMCAAAACVACAAAGSLALMNQGGKPASMHWSLPLGEMRLALDNLSALFLIMIGIVGLAAALYSWGYLGGGTGRNANRAYGPLFCGLLAAMTLTVCAADALVFLIGWEFTSLAAFFLVGLNDHDAEARKGAWSYLIATHLGTAAGVLPFFAAFIAHTGRTGMDHYAGAFADISPVACAALFALAVVGFGTKAGFVPFHVWLPLAHPVAPSPVSALMSGVVIKMGVYGLLRALAWLPPLPAYCGAGLLFLSAASALLGILNALAQRDVKRMLAYSSVENMGIIGIGISVGLLGNSFQLPVLTACGFGGALLHAFNHSLFKGLLFLSAGAVMHGTGTGNMESLGGLAKREKGLGVAFLIGSIAICALPPLNGLLGEYLIYGGLIHGAQLLPISIAAMVCAGVAVLAMTGAMALVVFSKAYGVIFLGQPRDPKISAHATPATMHAGMSLLAASCFAVVPLFGLFGQKLGGIVPQAALHDEFRRSLTFIASLGKPAILLLAIALTLWLLRRTMPRGRAGATWGCGYARPTSAMQYTGSSYGWTILSAFRQVVRPLRHSSSPGADRFPRASKLDTEQPDLALEWMYRPAFTGIARFFERLWPLQHGRIQLYLVYIVATVLFLFLVEACLSPFPGAAP